MVVCSRVGALCRRCRFVGWCLLLLFFFIVFVCMMFGSFSRVVNVVMIL